MPIAKDIGGLSGIGAGQTAIWTAAFDDGFDPGLMIAQPNVASSAPPDFPMELISESYGTRSFGGNLTRKNVYTFQIRNPNSFALLYNLNLWWPD